MKKVISFSLWGNNPKYTIGAVRNAELIPLIYPGWIGRFYCANTVPINIIEKLSNLNSEIVKINEPGNFTGSFWRFTAISDQDVDVMISRDTDSRLTNREALAVKFWLESGKLFHVMRDHPFHSVKILAGMWGAKKPILENMKKLIDKYKKENYKQVDQEFLHKVIWPKVKRKVYINDPFFDKKPFPEKRNNLEFVGKVWDENENTIPEHEIALQEYLSTHKDVC